MTRQEALNSVFGEMVEARARHRGFASWHEAYAVILEELDEFWDDVKADSHSTALTELAQVAACSILAMMELDGRGTDG